MGVCVVEPTDPGPPAEAAACSGPGSRPPTIDVRGVGKSFGRGGVEVHALREVSLSVESGDLVAIMGPSGSGKSTLMNVLGCLDAPDRGSYVLDGVDTGSLSEGDLAEIRNRKIGFVFQGFNLISRTPAIDNVELPLAYAGVGRRERRRRAAEALENVGLAERLDHQPSELSGGQQQRVAVARALVTRPALLLADEPTGALDSHTTDEVLELFSAINAEGRTVVLITHEEEVAEYVKRVVRLRDGSIVEDERRAPVEAAPPRLRSAARGREEVAA